MRARMWTSSYSSKHSVPEGRKLWKFWQARVIGIPGLGPTESAVSDDLQQ